MKRSVEKEKQMVQHLAQIEALKRQHRDAHEKCLNNISSFLSLLDSIKTIKVEIEAQ